MDGTRRLLVVGLAMIGLLLAGISTLVVSTGTAAACVTCGTGGCTCPEVLGDGALSCEIHSRTKLRFGWLSWATGIGASTECDCTPHGTCHREKKLDPKIKG